MTSALLSLTLAFAGLGAAEVNCASCHKIMTPNVVADWQASQHAANGVTCGVCHGTDHSKVDDVHKVKLPTPETCATCHPERVEQYKKGKHALAWTAMGAMPTTHFQPMAMIQGQKGCGGCHKIGLKTEEEILHLKDEGQAYGVASCDACHTRHTFSKKEAQQPQACMTCHTGFDHPQWEMYSGSKHGVRYLLKQNGTLPETTVAPTCQTCHMQDGDHEVRTAWGFLAVRLPLPEDEAWAADQVTVLKGLGVLDPEGKPTGRLEAVKAADVARLDQAAFDKERNKMLAACAKCHSRRFARGELAKGDQMIREADKLMAEGINLVAGLYKDGVIAKPESYAHAYPDLLTFHDTPTEIEQILWVMFLEHRMRTFQGTFHANPDYALWYGWSEMNRDIVKIRELAKTMRRDAPWARKDAAFGGFGQGASPFEVTWRQPPGTTVVGH